MGRGSGIRWLSEEMSEAIDIDAWLDLADAFGSMRHPDVWQAFVTRIGQAPALAVMKLITGRSWTGAAVRKPSQAAIALTSEGRDGWEETRPD